MSNIRFISFNSYTKVRKEIQERKIIFQGVEKNLLGQRWCGFSEAQSVPINQYKARITDPR
jgi:hypothetical protein